MRNRLMIGLAAAALMATMVPGVVRGAAADDPTVALVQGTLAQVGLDNAGTATFDDPRLSGTWKSVKEGPDGDCEEWDVSLANVRIENDGGTWRGSEAYAVDDPLFGFGLRGEGGYEGLSAVLFLVGGGDEEPYRLIMSGAIFPGTLPPATEPPCSEDP